MNMEVVKVFVLDGDGIANLPYISANEDIYFAI